MQTGVEADDVCNTGRLIINADDWGIDRETTNRIRECIDRHAVSSVSAMVFMADSERSASIAKEKGLDAGLHLNLTTPFTCRNHPALLVVHQQRISHFLRRHRFSQTLYHPGLVGSFKYVVAAQIDEFKRNYGTSPGRIDGHHHMHLSANVLLQRLLPQGTIVRRNFSFGFGEKSVFNRGYRCAIDHVLATRHPLVDFLFNLNPLEAEARLERISRLARSFVVEVEAHPANPEEYRALAGRLVFGSVHDPPIARGFGLIR